jgi:uncharacterized protein YjhX (UPF0386 family)
MDRIEANSTAGNQGLQPMPIGCNEADALRFLGCTENVFRDLRAAKIVKALRQGWYSYRQLAEAMENMELRVSACESGVSVRAAKKQKTPSNFEALPISERLSTREILKLHEQRSIRDAEKLW